MKICLIGSMQFSEKMVDLANELKELGHEPILTKYVKTHLGKSAEQKEKQTILEKNNEDAMREMWELIQTAEAILVVNCDKRGIRNYIGGNTLMEIGYAYVLRKKIFLLNPVPDIPYYKSEIEAVKPVILNTDLAKVA